MEAFFGKEKTLLPCVKDKIILFDCDGGGWNSSGEVIYMLNTLYLEGHFYGFLNEESYWFR